MIKRIALFSLIFLELSISATLLINYIKRQQNILGASISPLKVMNLESANSENFKHFYEPKANTQQKDPASWLSYVPEYIINADTLNQKDGKNYAVEKADKTYRIITLGDSFTFGQYINTGDNYSSKLDYLLNNTMRCSNINEFEVLNLGVGGYDIGYMVERFRIRGQKYNPDLVLWLITPDDMLRISELLRPRANKYTQQLKDTGEHEKLITRGEFYTGWNRAREEILKEIGEENILVMQKKYFQKFNSYYKNKLIIAMFPFMKQSHKKIIENFVSSRTDTYILDNLTNIYEEDVALPDGHPNKEGHSVIAQDLLNYIEENNIVNCEN